jgi:hypothetical protein
MPALQTLEAGTYLLMDPQLCQDWCIRLVGGFQSLVAMRATRRTQKVDIGDAAWVAARNTRSMRLPIRETLASGSNFSRDIARLYSSDRYLSYDGSRLFLTNPQQAIQEAETQYGDLTHRHDLPWLTIGYVLKANGTTTFRDQSEPSGFQKAPQFKVSWLMVKTCDFVESVGLRTVSKTAQQLTPEGGAEPLWYSVQLPESASRQVAA